MEKPTMHCQQELIEDLKYDGFIPETTMFKWFQDQYSTSKHLLTLYSMVRGLNAKTILEIGFGRSSFVLAKAAGENKGHFISCDSRDFSYLLNDKEKKVTEFVHAKSNKVWSDLNEGVDFAFLDYFSSPSISSNFIKSQINKCFKFIKQNGIIVVHDSRVKKYNVEKSLNSMKMNYSLLHDKKHEILSLPYNYGLGIIRRLAPSPYGAIEDHFQTKKVEG